VTPWWTFRNDPHGSRRREATKVRADLRGGDYLCVMSLCIGGELGEKCDALQVCPLCESCEGHCLTGGSGRCVDAHDAWLGGDSGGMVEVLARATPRAQRPLRPELTLGMRGALRTAQDALVEENGLRRCASCRGLEDPARPHRHGS
jgi:hypothetical protein